MQRYTKWVVIAVLLGLAVYGGQALWKTINQNPPPAAAEQAILQSLEERVPVYVIRVPGYRTDDGTNVKLEKMWVIKIHKPEPDETGTRFWPVDVYLKGTCAVRYGTEKVNGVVTAFAYEENCPIDGKARYELYRTPEGGWRAVPSKEPLPDPLLLGR